MDAVVDGISGAGVLDFVCAWYVLAARYVRGTSTRCAFVSTSSIAQGEQVAVLWSELYRLGMRIHFAHRTFRWSNEARGNAAVHCVIIGFGHERPSNSAIFEYASVDGPPSRVAASNINPYLVDAPDVLLHKRPQPVCAVPPIVFGSMPNDGGHLLLTQQERDELLHLEPSTRPWIREFLGAEDFIHRSPRWCLWLVDVTPAQLRALPVVWERVQQVRTHRESSKRATTKQLASTPSLFGEIRQPTGTYILIPRHSSENRSYIPMGFFGPDVVCGDSNLLIPNATTYHFGVLSSGMHMAWVRYVCGRLESRFRYSNTIVYNNFSWPESPSKELRAAVEDAAQGVLDARAKFPDSSLADLYDPLAMPRGLVQAHDKLDRAVEAAYGKRFDSDAKRVAFLFERYQKLTALFVEEPKPKRVTRSRRRP